LTAIALELAVSNAIDVKRTTLFLNIKISFYLLNKNNFDIAIRKNNLKHLIKA
jgi:hypothetical protein